jgi:hypothetical protein
MVCRDAYLNCSTGECRPHCLPGRSIYMNLLYNAASRLTTSIGSDPEEDQARQQGFETDLIDSKTGYGFSCYIAAHTCPKPASSDQTGSKNDQRNQKEERMWCVPYSFHSCSLVWSCDVSIHMAMSKAISIGIAKIAKYM